MNEQAQGKAAGPKVTGKSETKTLAPIERLKQILSAESVQTQFENALAENRGAFVASLIDVYGSDRNLQQCDPRQVVMEALKAATLKLPLNKQLGFSWLVPYRVNGVMVAQFQIGYRGYIQLAQRTGQYRYINADAVYEGELVRADKLTGEIDLSGQRASDERVGYFAYIETINGFRKTVYWTKEQVIAHAKKFSRSWGKPESAWSTNFDAMAFKTMLRHILGHYGILSVELMNALGADRDEAEEREFADEVEREANGEILDADYREADRPQGAAAQEPAF
ncbi:MAG: recombinase [Bacillota bacterium]|nr:MAG: recombinase [Bacillota bacterium]